MKTTSSPLRYLRLVEGAGPGRASRACPTPRRAKAGLIVLLAAALVSLSPAAEAGPFSRSSARVATSATTRRPNRVMRFLSRAFQRGPRSSQAPGRQSLSQGRPGLRSQARAEIAAYTQMMEGSIFQNATPPFALIHMTSGHTMRQVRQSSYKQGITARFEVSGLSGGSLPVTALFPVSGHVGQAEAARYARTNVYNVEIEYADGTSETMRINSTGFVTEKTLDLKLKKGTNFVRFYAEGSAGVGGFRSGREIELEYDGT